MVNLNRSDFELLCASDALFDAISEISVEEVFDEESERFEDFFEQFEAFALIVDFCEGFKGANFKEVLQGSVRVYECEQLDEQLPNLLLAFLFIFGWFRILDADSGLFCFGEGL